MTNYERLLNLTKEEMREFLVEGIDSCPYCRLDKHECDADMDGCRIMIEIWLESEVEE